MHELGAISAPGHWGRGKEVEWKSVCLAHRATWEWNQLQEQLQIYTWWDPPHFPRNNFAVVQCYLHWIYIMCPLHFYPSVNKLCTLCALLSKQRENSVCLICTHQKADSQPVAKLGHTGTEEQIKCSFGLFSRYRDRVKGSCLLVYKVPRCTIHKGQAWSQLFEGFSMAYIRLPPVSRISSSP